MMNIVGRQQFGVYRSRPHTPVSAAALPQFLFANWTSPIRATLAIRTIQTPSKLIKTPNSDHEQLFRYTSGRWLWDEEQQLQDRYKAFNVAELQCLAAKVIGSDSCISITKLAEGGYNKVFRLIMDDGKQILARIPNPNAGPEFYTTASEVATMEFCRDLLHIPVPQILAWSAASNNPVGSEYMIMEEANGTQLGLVWDDLHPKSKLSIMRGLVDIESKMLSVSFTHYGSIYFAHDAVEGAVPAVLTSEASPELKERISRKFSIGPTVERDFWNKERSSMNITRGPWQSSKDYVACIGKREIEWISRYAVPKLLTEAALDSSAQNSPEAHLKLLERYLKVSPSIIDLEANLTRPTLWHSDLHSFNIFVDDSRITAIIDWQGSWVGPLLVQAQPSSLVNYQGSILLKRPHNFDELSPDQQAEIKETISKSKLFQLYLLETVERNPLLARAFHLDHGKTRRLPVELAGNTWDDDIVSFREALINVERYWHELGIHGECPYHFTKDELLSHSVDAEDWNAVQDFFDSIDGLVKRDGWTNLEAFDAALEFFSELRKRGLNHMEGEERTIFERQTRWAEKTT